MTKMKEMYKSMLEGVENFYIKVLAKSGVSIADIGAADDESMLLIRDGLKLYGESKEYIYAYAELVDKQAEQIDNLQKQVAALVKYAEHQQERMDDLIELVANQEKKPAAKKAIVSTKED